MSEGRDYIGYSDRVPTITWPDNNRLAVSLVLNYEEGSERSIEAGDAADESVGELGSFAMQAPNGRNPTIASFFEYGSRVGAWRLLRILRRQDVKATVFACAVAVDRHAEMARAFVAAGHEICNHGYRWEDHFSFSAEEEAERIRRAQDLLERSTGIRPVGMFVNKGTTEHTRQILVEQGFLYDSNSYAEDAPYYVEIGDRKHLVLPYSCDTNDVRFWTTPGFMTGEAYCNYLCETLDVLLEEASTSGSVRMMSVGLHMRITGRPARARAIEQFIIHAKAQQGVWFARRDEIARWWLAHVPPVTRKDNEHRSPEPHA